MPQRKRTDARLNVGSTTIAVFTAWPYANAPTLHVGHLVGAVLPSDIFARFHRMLGHKVIHVTGTDMHGTPVSVKAQKAGKPAKEFAFENHARFVDQLSQLQIQFDLYIHTHNKIHFDVVNNMGKVLHKLGYLFPKTTQMLYDPKAGRYLPDRYVEGTCPYCGYNPARGDQCDNCGRILDPLELKEPVSKLTGTKPVVKDVTNLYLDLSKLQQFLEKWVKKQTHWRKHVREMTLGFLQEGLKPRPVTRNLDWGIPVDIPGFKDQVWYVWFEAVIGYLSAPIILQAMLEALVQSLEDAEKMGESEATQAIRASYAADSNMQEPFILFGRKVQTSEQIHLALREFLEYMQAAEQDFKPANDSTLPYSWQDFWQNPQVKHYYFLGKDNIPFHTIIWPAQIAMYNDKYADTSLLERFALPLEDVHGARRLNLPYDVPANNFLNLNSAKISKSTGNYIGVDELLRQYSVDQIRYAFARLLPENKDANFDMQRFKDLINNELVATIGNLTYRVIKFAAANFDGRLPVWALANADASLQAADAGAGAQGDIVSPKILQEVANFVQQYVQALGSVQLGRGLEVVLSLAKFGNQRFNDAAPWKAQDNAPQVVVDVAFVVATMAILLYPYVPGLAVKILKAFGVEGNSDKLGQFGRFFVVRDKRNTRGDENGTDARDTMSAVTGAVTNAAADAILQAALEVIKGAANINANPDAQAHKLQPPKGGFVGRV